MIRAYSPACRRRQEVSRRAVYVQTSVRESVRRRRPSAGGQEAKRTKEDKAKSMEEQAGNLLMFVRDDSGLQSTEERLK